MATWDTQLLSRIIRTGDIHSPLQWGITSDDFQTSEGKMLFQQLNAYYNMPETRGAVLGESAIRQMYPTFHLIDDSSMTMEALCYELRQSRVRSEGRAAVLRAAELMEADPRGAVAYLTAQTSYLQRLTSGKVTDSFADEAFDRVLQRYEMKAAGYTSTVCPWPWEPLQTESGGIEKDDYIVFYGRPKSMKSWVLMYMVAWAFDQGKRILFYTKEMSEENVFQRILCILAGVRYGEFRKGQLTDHERNSVYQTKQYVQMMRATTPMVCLSGKDAGEGGDTVAWLRSKVREHSPDIVFIDGIYLMADSRGGPKQKDHARVQNISRDLRQMVLDAGVPVLGTIQANRAAATNKEANLDEIAFSDSIGQDATLAVRVINEKGTPTLALMIGGSREFNLDGFRIYGVPATNFEYAGRITMDELLSAAEADAGDPKSAKKASSSRKRNEVTPATPSIPPGMARAMGVTL